MDLEHCYKLEWHSNTYFPAIIEVVMALNFQAPTDRNSKLYELSHTEVPKKCFSYSSYRRVCLSPDTQVRRKESLTFQESSDHEDVTLLPNLKQVQMLPIPGTPFLTLPDTDGFLQSQLCRLLFLCKALGKWPISEISTFWSLMLLQSGSMPTTAKRHPIQGF